MKKNTNNQKKNKIGKNKLVVQVPAPRNFVALAHLSAQKKAGEHFHKKSFKKTQRMQENLSLKKNYG